METITIINKSGKVMSTSKHLVNIFKDAKLAYQEKKAEFREERRIRDEERMSQRLLTERMRTSDIRSQSSHRSHRSRSQARLPRHTEEGPRDRRRPPLTIENLSQLEGSVVSGGTSRRSSRRGSEHGKPAGYQKPYMEDAIISKPSLIRRHTDQQFDHQPIIRRPTFPEMHTSPAIPTKNPIDMNLAYGEMHASHIPPTPEQKEIELSQQMSRLDSLLLEAQCIGHSATSIIQSLQKNPEAMAAVALTLAEISNLVKIMSPGILSAIKGSSPAIFALLICPEFLIGTGLAVGVTIVMFGGYKIIKKIQANAAATAMPSAIPTQNGPAVSRPVDAEGNEMDEAMVYEGDLSSVETWMRGVEESTVGDEMTSVATSVDGEIITPEAHSIRKMRTRDRIRERAREERERTVGARSEYSYRVPDRESSRRDRAGDRERSERDTGRSHSHHKSRTITTDDASTVPDSERSSKKHKNKGKEKKPSVLKVLFRGKSDKVKMVGA